MVASAELLSASKGFTFQIAAETLQLAQFIRTAVRVRGNDGAAEG